MSATSVCFYCANPPTPDRPLVWDPSGQRAHDLFPSPPDDGSPDELWDAALVPCPPVATSFVECAQCSHAVPVSDAFAAECRVQLEPSYRLSWTALTKNTEPFWERHDVAPADGNIEADAQTRGVVVERDSSGSPYALCADCADRWPEGATRKRYRATVTTKPATAEPAPSRAGALPADSWLDIGQVASLWKIGDRAARDEVRRLVGAGEIESSEIPATHGGSPKKVYRKVHI